MDPLELRLKNANEPGETTGQGMVLKTCGLKECLRTAALRAEWESKRATQKSKKNGRVRGIGMASLFHVGGGAKIYRSDGCGTMLKIDDFGGITLFTGSSEIGQGSETILAQIVAEEVGVSPAKVTVVQADTDMVPFTALSAGSLATYSAGTAARHAGQEARRRILKLVCPSPSR